MDKIALFFHGLSGGEKFVLVFFWIGSGVVNVFLDTKYVKEKHGLYTLSEMIEDDVSQNPWVAIPSYACRYLFFILGGPVVLGVRLFTRYVPTMFMGCLRKKAVHYIPALGKRLYTTVIYIRLLFP